MKRLWEFYDKRRKSAREYIWNNNYLLWFMKTVKNRDEKKNTKNPVPFTFLCFGYFHDRTQLLKFLYQNQRWQLVLGVIFDYMITHCQYYWRFDVKFNQYSIGSFRFATTAKFSTIFSVENLLPQALYRRSVCTIFLKTSPQPNLALWKVSSRRYLVDKISSSY